MPWKEGSLILSKVTNILGSPKLKELQTTISNMMKIAKSSPEGYKVLWEKEKLLSNSAFNRHVLKTGKNKGLLGKRLVHICDALYLSLFVGS